MAQGQHGPRPAKSRLVSKPRYRQVQRLIQENPRRPGGSQELIEAKPDDHSGMTAALSSRALPSCALDA